MRLLNIEFAPLHVPLHRRIETFAVFAWVVTFLSGIAAWLYFLLLVYFYPLSILPLCVYMLWVFFKDRHKGSLGLKRSSWVRSWAWWRYFRDYFPVKLHKTAELPPDKNYLLAVFPHGLFSMGAFTIFSTDIGGFAETFPGTKGSIAILSQHLVAPIFRELIIRLGCLPSSSKILSAILGGEAKGHAIALMVGGAQEAFYTKPGTYKIQLSNRRGFIKVCLKTGTALVPVISFGETDLYDQVQVAEGSLFRKFQNLVKKLTGISPLIMCGRGLFQYSFGIIPRRRPITVVVGKPMYLKLAPDPTIEEIEEIHKNFTQDLINLFEDNKTKFVADPQNTKLVIV